MKNKNKNKNDVKYEYAPDKILLQYFKYEDALLNQVQPCIISLKKAIRQSRVLRRFTDVHL